MYILYTCTHTNTHTFTCTALCCARALTAFTAASHEGFVCAGTINTLKSKNTQCVHVFRNVPQTKRIPFHFVPLWFKRLKPAGETTSCQRAAILWVGEHTLSLSWLALSVSLSLSLFDNTNSVSLQTGSALAHSRLAVFQFSPTLTRC